MRLSSLSVLLFLLALSAPAKALRCGNRVVSSGDHDFQVRERCGEPYWINTHSELLVAGIGGPVERRSERVYDEWYYNFGPRNLVQRLLFADGRLVKIENLGYGQREIGTDCNDTALLSGTTVGEVVLRCGEPERRSRRYQDVVVRDGLGNARIQPVQREEWLYRLRGSRYARLAIFHNGRLDRVERVAP